MELLKLVSHVALILARKKSHHYDIRQNDNHDDNF